MKILRNITNISSGASFPLISPLAHRLSSFWHPLSHSDSAIPPFHLPPKPPQMSAVDAQAMLYVSLLLCVCVSVEGWQRNNNNAACPTSFIRLHKLIRPRCSHHLFYWERRREHSQGNVGFWVLECGCMVVGLLVLGGVQDGMWCCDMSFTGRTKVCEFLELYGRPDTLDVVCGHVWVASKC